MTDGVGLNLRDGSKITMFYSSFIQSLIIKFIQLRSLQAKIDLCDLFINAQGLQCDQPILQTCRTTPCAYGSCQLNINGQYACVCATPGYEGPFCEIERCSPRCDKGYCNRDTSGNYFCTCASSYKGASCSELGTFSSKYKNNFFKETILPPENHLQFSKIGIILLNISKANLK